MMSPNLRMKDEIPLKTPTRNDENIDSQLIGHHFATILNGNDMTVQYSKRCHGEALVSKVHDVVLHWFCKEFGDINSNLFGKSIIKIYSEYKRETIHYCAHPNFCRSGPWHDWVMVIYELFD